MILIVGFVCVRERERERRRAMSIAGLEVN